MCICVYAQRAVPNERRPHSATKIKKAGEEVLKCLGVNSHGEIVLKSE